MPTNEKIYLIQCAMARLERAELRARLLGASRTYTLCVAQAEVERDALRRVLDHLLKSI